MSSPKYRKDQTGRVFWERDVPQRWKGRTDISLNVLRDARVDYAVFRFRGSADSVMISTNELRRCLIGAKPRSGKIVFTLDPIKSWVDRKPAVMGKQ